MKFIVNEVEWEIVETTQKEIKKIINDRRGNSEKEDIDSLDSRFYGTTFVDMCKIYLDKDLPEQRKRKTLLHELSHCYIVSYITHEEKSYDEEMVADIISNSYDFIKKILLLYFKE